MDARLEALPEELHEEGVAHDASKADRTERRRNLEPDSARLLHFLALATGAKRVLELGTSNGYSTIWLGDAVAANGGILLGVDNVLSHAAEVADFRTLVTADRRVTEALAPTGAGLLLVTRLP